jgi:hypothetical protein
MKRLRLTVALAAAAALALTLPLHAADPLPWPWKAKLPPDPALVELTHVEDLSVAIDKANPPVLSITVKVEAPTPGFGELQLVYRVGDPKDRIFSFDARGRAPQNVAAQVLTPVTIEASYADAPVGNFDVIEVYAKDNCVAYSVTEGKKAECSTAVPPE